jgi:hypothetical protein
LKEKSRIPIPTYFTDSSQLMAPFMNSKKSANGYEFTKNVKFLGRSGIIEFKGLRIAFLSGIDSDLLGDNVFND